MSFSLYVFMYNLLYYPYCACTIKPDYCTKSEYYTSPPKEVDLDEEEQKLQAQF
jgi:hypothetical protein